MLYVFYHNHAKYARIKYLKNKIKKQLTNGESCDKITQVKQKVRFSPQLTAKGSKDFDFLGAELYASALFCFFKTVQTVSEVFRYS